MDIFTASSLSGLNSVAVMAATFAVLYLTLLKWWEASSRWQQAVRAGLWAVVLLTPFAMGPALGMDSDRAIKGITVLIVVFFISGAVVGGLYSISPLYKRRENNNA